MSAVEIVPLYEMTVEAHYVADRLRVADQAEIRALTDVSDAEAIRISIERAREAYLVRMSDGEPFAVFGAGYNAIGSVSAPWFLASDRLREVTATFIRQSHDFIRHVRGYSNHLENVVHADNRDSIRYLKAMGFGFAPARTLPNGARVHTFMMEGLKNVH